MINTVTILMMSAKMATLDFLKTKAFWKKGYDVLIYVHDVINNISSRDSSNIVDVLGPNFGNSNISMRKVIINLIL